MSDYNKQLFPNNEPHVLNLELNYEGITNYHEIE